jgi:hypothetical protein
MVVMFFTILWSVEDLKGFKLQNQSVFLCVIVVGFLLLQLDVDYAYQYNEKIEHNKWFNQGQKNKQDETKIVFEVKFIEVGKKSPVLKFKLLQECVDLKLSFYVECVGNRKSNEHDKREQ